MISMYESNVVATSNARAPTHPCLQCGQGMPGQRYGGTETYICRHPVAAGKIGCKDGVHHHCRKKPTWCPYGRYGENV